MIGSGPTLERMTDHLYEGEREPVGGRHYVQFIGKERHAASPGLEEVQRWHAVSPDDPYRPHRRRGGVEVTRSPDHRYGPAAGHRIREI